MTLNKYKKKMIDEFISNSNSHLSSEIIKFIKKVELLDNLYFKLNRRINERRKEAEKENNASK